jgi:hypothetical protein
MSLTVQRFAWLQELGHAWVDVLKIDIEGGEWEVLDGILREPGVVPFTQLQVRCMSYASVDRHERFCPPGCVA